MPKISSSSTSNSNTCPTVLDLITVTTAKVLVEAVAVVTVATANNLRRVHMKTNTTWINNIKRRKQAVLNKIKCKTNQSPCN